MLLTEHLVQGVDVWINTPRRPWEACGTSGMKVLVNGGINLSELDGWWAEAYTKDVGWALGDGQEHGEDPAWDDVEAHELYDLLEKQVIPEFYNRNENGIPTAWVQRMRKSMATLTPRFSANRTVREYAEKYYLPAAANFLRRAANKGAEGKRIIDIHNEFRNKWGGIQLEKVVTENIENGYIFQLYVLLNGINPDHFLVELYADELAGSLPEKLGMERVPANSDHGEYLYKAQVTTGRPSGDYTPRIIPNYQAVAIPLEENLILWQR